MCGKFIIFSFALLASGLKLNLEDKHVLNETLQTEGRVVPIASFKLMQPIGLYRSWEPVNDPVMGGVSVCSMVVAGGLCRWYGTVMKVPALNEPGFCNIQTPGLYKEAGFPDLTGTSGIIVRAKILMAKGLTNFKVQIMSEGAKDCKGAMPVGDYMNPMKLNCKMGTYDAVLPITTTMTDMYIPWTSFKCTWRGKPVWWCPPLYTQLKMISSVGLSTSYKAGPFRVGLESVSAK